MIKRKICIVTGSRAEYGILQPLMEEIKSDAGLQLQVIATAMHLSPEFGSTYQEIEKDGFKIDEKIEILLSSDTSVGVSKSMGLGMISFAEAYARLKPDLIVGLGDRFELFSAVASALVSKIPVAQLSSGDVTEGALDDSLRHCITKMSHLLFTTTEKYRKRVIQLGEDPKRVFNVGALALENIKKLKLLSINALEKKINFKFNKHNLLITFHPETLGEDISQQTFKNLLSVIDGLKDTNVIFTKANADAGGRAINDMIEHYVSQNSQRSIAFVSMGQLKYLSAMQFVDAVVGNTSSGIVETPSFKVGTINIGDRQKGRIRAKSIIDCQSSIKSIMDAFKKLYSTKYQNELKKVVNPYEKGNSAKEIKNILKEYDLRNILKKVFHDV